MSKEEKFKPTQSALKQIWFKLADFLFYPSRPLGFVCIADTRVYVNLGN
jgi:hypothetical protein